MITDFVAMPAPATTLEISAHICVAVLGIVLSIATWLRSDRE